MTKKYNFDESIIQQFNFINIPAGTSKTLSPYCPINCTKIYADKDDVYSFEKGKFNDRKILYGLKKNLLYRIADAAGLQWSPESSLLKNDNNITIYKAIGMVRGLDGSYTPFSAIKELNLILEEKKIKEEMLNLAYQYKNSVLEEEKEVLNGKIPEEWAEIQTKMKILILRRNKVAVAETGGKLRLIRNIFKIKSGYTQEELQKGFLVSRVDFVPDLNDADVKKMFINIGFNNTLYKSINKQYQIIDIE